MITPTPHRQLLRVAVPSPLWQCFDYWSTNNAITYQPGMRVRVSFGRSERIGMIVELPTHTELPDNKIKSISAVIDTKPLITTTTLKLCQWASTYYHYPIGEVLLGTLPKLLRQGGAATIQKPLLYQLSALGEQALINPTTSKRAPKQTALLQYLKTHPGSTKTILKQQGFDSSFTKKLLDKKYIVTQETPTLLTPSIEKLTALMLTPEQQQACDAINQQTGFKTFLLDGVTGSGKTEVYLRCIEKVLQQGKQALILVPEIGLTPQTLSRFRARFPEKIAVLHSKLNDTERAQAWLMAAQGEANIVIGTRSAIFASLPRLGIIIIDEEHDLSFKQQSGFRYSARDLAIVRAQLDNIPVVLGSATPSLESLYNAKRDRYNHLILPSRPGAAKLPTIKLTDIRQHNLLSGLSETLMPTIAAHLAAGEQVLLFLNRRGYAPVLMCHHCGWNANCQHCDARMTLHYQPRRLHCHHCAATQAAPNSCPECKQGELLDLGVGTEKLEAMLQEQFPHYPPLRIDRDSTKRKGSLDTLLERAYRGESQLLLGTQLLAKGHHLPNLTLVIVMDADGSLFSADFRAVERMAQLLLQVAGRAGRADKPGKVFIQTHHPDHELLQCLLKAGYTAFSEKILTERQQAGLPPYTHLALLRAEALQASAALDFLQQAKQLMTGYTAVTVLGPISATMKKKADQHRAQLLLQSPNRQALQQQLAVLAQKLPKSKRHNAVRWSLDVDPLEI